MRDYFERIAVAESLAELEDIIETAADDDWISTETYLNIYDAAVMKVKTGAAIAPVI